MASAFDDADCRDKHGMTAPSSHHFGLHSFACYRCEQEIERIKLPGSDWPLVEEPVSFIEDQLTLAKRRNDLLKWVPVLEQVLRLKAAWKGRVDWSPKEEKVVTNYSSGVWKQEHNVDFSKAGRTNFGKPAPLGILPSQACKDIELELCVLYTPIYKLDPSAAKNGLYGFVPIVINKWCKFKDCGIITEGSHLCPKHLGELAKLEGGPGIAPKHRYVTQGAAHKNVIVTCDVGADWE